MSDAAALDQLLAMQAESGAFPSTVETIAGRHRDETCFVTANVVLLLTDVCRLRQGTPAMTRSIERGLSFLERCADPKLPGAFHFYPPGAGGYQVHRDLPPDLDDTALAWMALIKAGVRTRAEAASTLGPLFDRCRIRARVRGDAPWVRAGVYRTWIDARNTPNPADLCVNANALACREMAGLPPEPSLQKALTAALRLWNATPANLRLLSPYYAHPDELTYAIARAVEAGALPAIPLSDLSSDASGDQPLFSEGNQAS